MTVWTQWIGRHIDKHGADQDIVAMRDAPGGRQDLVTGEGDVTLEQALQDSPGAELVCLGCDAVATKPDDNESVFAINQRLLDVMSATHLMRGFLCVPGVAFVWLGIKAAIDFAVLTIEKVMAGNTRLDMLAVGLLAVVAFSGGAWVFWRYFVSFDWFHYRANPIRFDRERRMVHVWRSARVGGPFSVPWDDSLYLIRGMRDGDKGDGARIYPTTLLSIDPATRLIRRRIGVGKMITNQTKSDGFIAYIQRYMADGPQAVPTPQRWARMTPSLAYSFNAYFNVTGALELKRQGELGLAHLIFVAVLSPLLALLSVAHFIAILTGREPKWPAEMR
jgi:hypothetical protein